MNQIFIFDPVILEKKTKGVFLVVNHYRIYHQLHRSDMSKRSDVTIFHLSFQIEFLPITVFLCQFDQSFSILSRFIMSSNITLDSIFEKDYFHLKVRLSYLSWRNKSLRMVLIFSWRADCPPAVIFDRIACGTVTRRALEIFQWGKSSINDRSVTWYSNYSFVSDDEKKSAKRKRNVQTIVQIEHINLSRRTSRNIWFYRCIRDREKQTTLDEVRCEERNSVMVRCQTCYNSFRLFRPITSRWTSHQRLYRKCGCKSVPQLLLPSL